MKLPYGVTLSQKIHILTQDNDSCELSDDGQELVIKTEDAGGGPFVIIETKRWAINSDEIDMFAQMLKDVLNGVH